MTNDPVAAKLRQLLLTEFTEAELMQLCKELGLNYDALQGIGAFGKTRALIEEARSKGKLRLLQKRVRDLRPLAYFQAGFASEEPLEIQTKQVATQRKRTTSSSRSPLLVFLTGTAIAAAVFLLLPLTFRSASPPSEDFSTTPEKEAAANFSEAVAASTGLPSISEIATPTSPPSPLASTTPEVETTLEAETTAPLPTPDTPGLHPAVSVIYQANEQLREFFRGEEDIRALEAHWEPELVEQLSTFANTRLMRLMRLAPSQRSALRVQLSYVRPPALVDEFAGEAVVSAREYWEYTTEVNRVRVCETRDYLYRLRKTDDRFRIYAYTGRLVSNRCQ